mmetsp:Transcript_52423/g.162742  ORF Transcript_52423/g.162742 Transcript_52423/m.162742 type:complete len:268 (-) Transcript_52423:365-1168(-)
MVLLEFAVAKGAALTGIGLVKVASASTGAAAAAILPAPGALDSPLAVPAPTLASLLDLGSSLSSLAGAAFSSLTEWEKAGFGITAASAMLCSFVAYRGEPLGGLDAAPGLRDGSTVCAAGEAGRPEDDPGVPRALFLAVPLFAVLDSCSVGIVVHSVGQALTVPLRTWVVGGVLLSFPTSWAIRYAVGKKGIRFAFVLESAAVAASFAWLCWGTNLIIASPQGMHTAPLLWWSSFGQCAVMWSVTGVTSTCMILMTVFTVLPCLVQQ